MRRSKKRGRKKEKEEGEGGGSRARKKERRGFTETPFSSGPGRSWIIITVLVLYLENWNPRHTILFFWGKEICQARKHCSFPCLCIQVWADISMSLLEEGYFLREK